MKNNHGELELFFSKIIIKKFNATERSISEDKLLNSDGIYITNSIKGILQKLAARQQVITEASDEAMSAANDGTVSTVNLSVGDIYGGDYDGQYPTTAGDALTWYERDLMTRDRTLAVHARWFEPFLRDMARGNDFPLQDVLAQVTYRRGVKRF